MRKILSIVITILLIVLLICLYDSGDNFYIILLCICVLLTSLYNGARKDF